MELNSAWPSFKPLLIEWRDITQKAYPDFVWKARPKSLSGVLPIFSFHTVTPHGFEQQLQFLKKNRYHTVIADEAVRFVNGELELPDNSIMLSFDDGRLSVWAIIFPLLKKYGFRATVFLTPDLVRPTDGLSPNLDDVWNGKSVLSDVENCDQRAQPAISWQKQLLWRRRALLIFRVILWGTDEFQLVQGLSILSIYCG